MAISCRSRAGWTVALEQTFRRPRLSRPFPGSQHRSAQDPAFDIQPDSVLAIKRPFDNLGSDGMTIDAHGNVYLAGRGVTGFEKTGMRIEHIDVAELWTANITFGHQARDLLFITASKNVYGLKMRVKGAR